MPSGSVAGRRRPGSRHNAPRAAGFRVSGDERPSGSTGNVLPGRPRPGAVRRGRRIRRVAALRDDPRTKPAGHPGRHYGWNVSRSTTSLGVTMSFDLQETTIHGGDHHPWPPGRVSDGGRGPADPADPRDHGLLGGVGARRTAAGAPPHGAGAGPARARSQRQAPRRLFDGRVRVGDPGSGPVARARPRDGRRPFARWRGGDAVRLPVPGARRAARRWSQAAGSGGRSTACFARPPSPARSSYCRCSPAGTC